YDRRSAGQSGQGAVLASPPVLPGQHQSDQGGGAVVQVELPVAHGRQEAHRDPGEPGPDPPTPRIVQAVNSRRGRPRPGRTPSSGLFSRQGRLPLAIAVIGIAAAFAIHAQSPESATFEVVSIKVHTLAPGQIFLRFAGAKRVKVQGDRYAEKVITLPDLIEEAYGVMDYQVLGVPDWATSARG